MELLTIGAFALAAELTPRALRLYDRMGLLPPAGVDPESGYRLYDPAQVDRARLIGRLRRIGMPLAEISTVCELATDDSVAAVAAYRQRVTAEMAERTRAATLLVHHLSGKDTMDEQESMTLRVGRRCDIGAVRRTNEDQAYADHGILAVADGGQGPGGAEASAAAIAAVSSVKPADVTPAELLAQMGMAVAEADAAVRDLADDDHAPISTVTALVHVRSQVALIHIGDSRAYLYRDGELSQLTRDHSVVARLVERGELTVDEASRHPERAVLVRALGTGPEPVEADLGLRTLRAGDRYLLCTDGLSAVIERSSIAAALSVGAEPEEIADQLVALAHDRGAPDNIACVVADVHRH